MSDAKQYAVSCFISEHNDVFIVRTRHLPPTSFHSLNYDGAFPIMPQNFSALCVFALSFFHKSLNAE